MNEIIISVLVGICQGGLISLINWKRLQWQRIGWARERAENEKRFNAAMQQIRAYTQNVKVTHQQGSRIKRI